MAVILTLLMLLATSASAAASPLATGRWDYRLSWNGIPAAYATVQVSRDPQTAEPVYRVEAVAKTNWLVDLLWSLRAEAVSLFTPDDLAPRGFRYDREVNKEHSVTEVVFHSSAPTATGTFKRRGETKVLDTADPGVLDPITAIFRALNGPLRVGDTLRYEIFTGESRYRVELEVAGEEPVTVAGVKYPAWRIEPHVWKIGTGLEPRLRHATIWVSKEPVRTVLRIRSEVFIGAVNCELLPPPAATPAS